MRKVICLACILTVISGCFTALAEDYRIFILCNPKTCVNVRNSAKKGSEIVGWLDFGDWVETDGKKENGFIHVYGIGEYGEGWVFAGYVVEDQPEKTDKVYASIGASGRVMSYRWINGRKNGWLKVCEEVKILGLSEEWAVTDKGYIRTKYLEVWYE